MEKPRPCATCAKGFTPGKSWGLYCSDRCRVWWLDRDPAHNRRKQKARQARPRSYTCDWCGAAETDTVNRVLQRRHAHAGLDLCGACRDLRPGAISCEVSPATPLKWANCEACDRSILSSLRGARKRYCSELCRRIAGGWVPTECAIHYAECRRCAKTAVLRGHVESGFCSSTCAKRQRRADRKHHERSTGKGQSVTLREIAERDGWRCHLCGKPVPDRDYKRRALDPTLDHLIPVSAGGPHTRDNLALAHNRCNYERGAEGAAQLRLVG